MFNNSTIRRFLMAIVSLTLIISFTVFTVNASSNEIRPQLPEGPIHTNQLLHMGNNYVPLAEKSLNITASSNVFSSSAPTSGKILIVTSGHGPLTGISPIAEKDYWYSIILNMGLDAPDWYDGTPTIDLLNQYDLVIYDAGGYWYPLSDEVGALWDYHFAGKPLIVVAPDINFDWANIKATSRPTFVEDVLHIEGVLGILPEASFEVIANTGHDIVKSLPTNQYIPVASQSSFPDTFDPSADAESVLTQGFISATEFGIGTSSGLPQGSPYDPQGMLFSIVAYPGSANEGRTVTFGFPPTALQDAVILDTLAKSTISWALGAKKIPVTLYLEDAPSDVKVNKAPGNIIDVVELIENQETSSENVDVRLEIPSDLFGNPTKVFIRDNFTDISESTTVTWTEQTSGIYSASINLPSNTKKQIVWRFNIPETASAQDNFKLTGSTYVNNLISSSDDALIKIISSSEAIIITNRKVLFDKFGDTQAHRDDIHSLLRYLYKVSDSNSAGEKNGVVIYVDRYDNTVANWNQNVDYSNENTANAVANAIDTLIETEYNKLSSHPQFLMIVGGDEIIPFYRVKDLRAILNLNQIAEKDTKYADPADPVLSIISHDYFPTDNIYADIDPFSRRDMSTPDLSTGRISAASAKDMRQLISNGISSPAKINNAVVASIWGLDMDTVVQKLTEKDINILNDDEEPRTVESASWHMNDLRNIMLQNDFQVFAFAGHSNWSRLGTGGNDFITPKNVGDIDEISNNKPFVAIMACHAGIVTDQDGSTWNPEWDDNNMWAFIHKGASGVLASGSFVSTTSASGMLFDEMIHGEQLYNDFFEYLITGSETTRSVGEALKLADNKYNPGWITSDADKKTVLQYFIFGVPWMQLDPPVTFDDGNINSNVIISSTSPIKIEDNTYKKTFEIDISDYSISSVNQFDLITIEESQLILSDLKPILPKINIEISLPHESNIKDVNIIPAESISLGNLNIPSFQSSVIENMADDDLTAETDVSGLFPTPRFVVHTSKIDDHELVTIGIAPVQYDTITHEANFFAKTILEITYETPSPIVVTELTMDKPSYNSGEEIITSTSIDNIGDELMSGVHLDLIIKDMVGQVQASTSSESFDLPMGPSTINAAISSTGLPQGSYILEITAIDSTNTPRAATSTFIYISSGKISNFLITPNSVIQGNDITFEFSFENFASTSVEANSAVHIYNKAGIEVAYLPATPVIVDANSMKTVSVSWNTEGKGAGDYTAQATISTADNMFGPLFGAFEILSSNTPPVVSIDLDSQTLQYSDGITATMISATDIDSSSLTLSTSWVKDGGSPQSGLPAGLSQSLEGCIPDGSSVTCTWTLGGPALVDAGNYDITFKVSDEVDNVEEHSTLIVEPEDAACALNSDNQVTIQVASPGGNAGTFSLKVDVTEALPDDISDVLQTQLPGDINLADLSISLVPVGPGSSIDPISCTGDVDGTEYDATKIFTCEFNDVGVNTYSVQVTVNGGHYIGSGEDVLVIYDPSLGFTTGGGHFMWPETGEKTNFGYTMKYSKKGTNIKGNLLLVRHLPDGTIYRLKSNALHGLALGELSENGETYGWASFSGKSTYFEPEWPEPEGNHEFIVYVEDYNELGNGLDRFWIKVKGKDGSMIDVMSMNDQATENSVELKGGNIVVPHKGN